MGKRKGDVGGDESRHCGMCRFLRYKDVKKDDDVFCKLDSFSGYFSFGSDEFGFAGREKARQCFLFQGME